MIKNRFNKTIEKNIEVAYEVKKMGGFENKGNISDGEITRRILARKGIESPDIKQRIKIAPGLWVVPKEELKTQDEINAFIEDRREKLGVGKIKIR